MQRQLLRSICKHHQQWTLDGKYEPLPEPASEVGRSLNPEEEVRLIHAAKCNPEWAVAYHATILENETGMRGFELRNLQLKRVDLMAGDIQLQKSKTKGGVRTIPLSADALESAKELIVRARSLGASQPDHYLIPAFVSTVVKDGNGATVRVRRYDPMPRRKAGGRYGASLR
jgi:integrase